MKYLPDDPTPLVRRVQYSLYEKLIEVYPVESAHGDGWHQADCDTCGWRTDGMETVVEDAGYEHITNIHMAAWDDIIEPLSRAFFAWELT